jgi:hypothetical protein
MMTYHPEAGIFCKATSKNGLSRTYHVQFFGAKATRAWVHRNMLAAHDDMDGKGLLDDPKAKKKAMSARLATDLVLATAELNAAAAIRTSERLLEFIQFGEIPPEIPSDEEYESEEDEKMVYVKQKDPNRPKRANTAFFAFMNDLRPKLMLSNPDMKITELASAGGEQWRALTDEAKVPYEKLAEEDKVRYAKDMETYVVPPEVLVKASSASKGKKKKMKKMKDPLAPKRQTSSYFFFMMEMRTKTKEKFPDLHNNEISTKLGLMWGDLSDGEKVQYETLAAADKARYIKEMETYTPPTPVVQSPPPSKSPEPGSEGLGVDDAEMMGPVAKPVPARKARSIYFQETGAKLKEENPDIPEDEMQAKCGASWTELPLGDRIVYTERAKDEMTSYEQQQAAYEAAGGDNQKKKRRKSLASDETREAKKAKLAKKEVCATCERHGNVIPCSSGCGNAYHSWCIGLNGIPSEPFKCDACFTGNQRCFVCDSSGGGSLGSLMQCDSERCNKFYHTECAKSLPRSKFDTADLQRSEDGEKFFCPLHTCANCDQGVSGKSIGKLIRCIRCPTVYHGACVPAGVETKQNGRIVCPRHFTKIESGKTRPSCNFCVVCSEGGELVVCDGCPGTYHKECISGTVGNEYEEGSDWNCQDCCGGTKPMINDVVWCKVGNHRWWPSQILSEEEIPQQLWKMNIPIGNFCVKFLGGNEHQWVNNAQVISWMEGDQTRRFAQGVKKPPFQRALDAALEVFAKRTADRKEVMDELRGNIVEKPAEFKKIRTNLYVCPKPRLIEVPECMCEAGSDCGDDCLNRMMMIECNPKRCPAGATCTNNRLLKHRYPKLKVWKTPSAGYGLKAEEPLKEGNLVCEYIGEVIDEQECQRRLEAQEKAGTVSFYILAVDSGMYIDARLKASVARFANHSCEPNCNVHKWNVNGLMKIGIFANRDVSPGEELTFDYQLDVNGREKMKVCYCGAPSCRGFLGKKKSEVVKEEPKKGKGGKKRSVRRTKAEMRAAEFPWECEFECGFDAKTEAEVDEHEAICTKKGGAREAAAAAVGDADADDVDGGEMSVDQPTTSDSKRAAEAEDAEMTGSDVE